MKNPRISFSQKQIKNRRKKTRCSNIQQFTFYNFLVINKSMLLLRIINLSHSVLNTFMCSESYIFLVISYYFLLMTMTATFLFTEKKMKQCLVQLFLLIFVKVITLCESQRSPESIDLLQFRKRVATSKAVHSNRPPTFCCHITLLSHLRPLLAIHASQS